MATLPSWITSIDPVAGVSRLLQGFGLGAQVGESQRRGEQADIELANRASMFNQELAQKEAASLREYDLHQQVEKAKAETAARNLSGMYEYQQLIAAGVPKDKALMQTAPNLFYNHPDKMASAMQELDQERRMKEYQDRQLAISQGHLDVSKERLKAEQSPTAISQPIELKTPSGVHLGWGQPGAKGSVHVLPEPSSEMKPAQKASVITKALTDIGKQLSDVKEGSDEQLALKAQQEEYRDILRGIALGEKRKVIAPGSIHKGYRFKGGDPSKKESWEKVQ